MKIKQLIEDEMIEVTPGCEEFTLETPPGVTSTVALSEDGLTSLEVEEFITGGERKAIRFKSPVSGVTVEVLKPTVLDMIEVERYLKKKHPNAGTFEQIIVNLSFLICRYGDKKGEKCMSFQAIQSLEEINEIYALNIICNQFFRIGQI